MIRIDVRRTVCHDPKMALVIYVNSADMLTGLQFYMSEDAAKALMNQLGEVLQSAPKPVGLPSEVAA